ncbi:MAG: hypothetical protein AABX54_03410 [Nanoarchaeota archaeon]
MVKKRVKRKISEFKKIERKIEREIEHEIKDVEKWVIERRKFFIKLGWTVLLVAALLIFSHFFLRVKGAGI